VGTKDIKIKVVIFKKEVEGEDRKKNPG